MSEFHFLRPAWFLALVPALFLLLWLWRRRGNGGGWQSIVAPALLPYLLLDRGHVMQRVPLALLGLGWLLAVTALAGPAWERQPQPVYRVPVDRVLVLDLSPSMAAADLRPDRLTRARLAVQALLAGAQEGRTALVVFGAEPHVVTPLTDDTATIEALLPALSTDILPAPGDRAGPALRMAAELLRRVGSTRGEVLLLSDGISDPADALEAIQELRRRNVSTSVLGVGTTAGAPAPDAQGGFVTGAGGGVRLARLDETGLTALARAGGGRYRRLGEGPVTALLSQTIARNPAQALDGKQGLERWVEQGPWLLLPLLLIAAGGFRRGWLGVVALLLIPPPQAQAFGWDDLWLRQDQQASRLLEQGQAAAAAERFADPAWQATARYRAGDYDSAAAGFTGEDAESRYNRGNALARAGHLQEALAAYDQALAQQPGHADARYNRDLVEKLLQSRSQAQSSGQDSGSDSSQNDAQAGAGQEGAAADQDGQQQGDSRSGASSAGDSGTQAGEEPQSGGNAGANVQAAADKANPEPAAQQSGSGATGEPDAQPAAGDADTQQRAGTQKPSPGRDGHTTPDPSDSAEQARADVAPATEAESREPREAQAQADTGEGPPPPSATTDTDTSREPLSEQQLALEQWLHQVPDDPAGLLRRKFMLEHLMRQKGQPSL